MFFRALPLTRRKTSQKSFCSDSRTLSKVCSGSDTDIPARHVDANVADKEVLSNNTTAKRKQSVAGTSLTTRSSEDLSWYCLGALLPPFPEGLAKKDVLLANLQLVNTNHRGTQRCNEWISARVTYVVNYPERLQTIVASMLPHLYRGRVFLLNSQKHQWEVAQSSYEVTARLSAILQHLAKLYRFQKDGTRAQGTLHGESRSTERMDGLDKEDWGKFSRNWTWGQHFLPPEWNDIQDILLPTREFPVSNPRLDNLFKNFASHVGMIEQSMALQIILDHCLEAGARLFLKQNGSWKTPEPSDPETSLRLLHLLENFLQRKQDVGQTPQSETGSALMTTNSLFGRSEKRAYDYLVEPWKEGLHVRSMGTWLEEAVAVPVPKRFRRTDVNKDKVNTNDSLYGIAKNDIDWAFINGSSTRSIVSTSNEDEAAAKTLDSNDVKLNEASARKLSERCQTPYAETVDTTALVTPTVANPQASHFLINEDPTVQDMAKPPMLVDLTEDVCVSTVGFQVSDNSKAKQHHKTEGEVDKLVPCCQPNTKGESRNFQELKDALKVTLSETPGASQLQENGSAKKTPFPTQVDTGKEVSSLGSSMIQMLPNIRTKQYSNSPSDKHLKFTERLSIEKSPTRSPVSNIAVTFMADGYGGNSEMDSNGQEMQALIKFLYAAAPYHWKTPSCEIPLPNDVVLTLCGPLPLQPGNHRFLKILYKALDWFIHAKSGIAVAEVIREVITSQGGRFFLQFSCQNSSHYYLIENHYWVVEWAIVKRLEMMESAKARCSCNLLSSAEIMSFPQDCRFFPPTRFDVFVGLKPSVSVPSGTIRFFRMVSDRCEAYRAAGKEFVRHMIDDIIERVVERGGRFFRIHDSDSNWEVLSASQMFEVIAMTLEKFSVSKITPDAAV